MSDYRILYEDEYIMGVYKPYGMLSTSDDSALDVKLSLYRTAKGEDGYIGCVHRLDRTTQGIMIYSKTREMTSYLNAQIQSGKMIKEYLGIFEGEFEESGGELEDLLYYDRQKNKSYVVKRERKGVKKAKLSYTVIFEKDDMSLLKVRLYTGRTHQIRVQFSHIHHPLAGDRRYGSKTDMKEIMLCSSSISFEYPCTKEIKTLEYIPDNYLFAEMIK